MHVAFIPYGARAEVERFMRDIEATNFKMKMWKEGEEDTFVPIKGQVRQLLGVTEVVFPREALNVVLNTLTGRAPNRFSLDDRPRTYKTFALMLRKVLNLQPIPEDRDEEAGKLLWDMEYVSILPIGIREDGNLVECKDMGYKDWNHESI